MKKGIEIIILPKFGAIDFSDGGRVKTNIVHIVINGKWYDDIVTEDGLVVKVENKQLVRFE